MASSRTARERARAEIQSEIMRVGRAQLGEVGAAALSLRAVARELGMVSSAVYRYVASRDELLTRLIDDAYNSLGDSVEAAVAASVESAPRERWLRGARATRTWALDHVHEYSLLYGSPVPGYEAPESTSVSGTRASRALIGIVRDAVSSGQLVRTDGPGVDVPTALADEFDTLRSEIDLEVDDALLLDLLTAWSQLFGLISFEVFGQTRGVVTSHDLLFDNATLRMADVIGLS